MKSNYPLCPFCTDKTTCVRHTEKGYKAPKVQKPIPKMSAKKKVAQPKEKAENDRMKAFYNEMLNIMPYDCMECGNELFASTVINPRTVVAHILAKAKYPSVDTNTDNIMFFCCDCHNRFDLQTEKFMSTAKSTPTIKQRVSLLIPFLSTEEVNRLPPYLLNT